MTPTTYTYEFDIHGDLIPCSTCGSEAPTYYAGDKRQLCRFCFNMIGRPDDSITKRMLCEGLNELLLAIRHELK